mmetsp:Transcript_16946/g.40963  ORF Transcript_16946/g.40963 Transcript_16946/m.40963 type:complete len:226 (-) Transcript_16946:35-712(-)
MAPSAFTPRRTRRQPGRMQRRSASSLVATSPRSSPRVTRRWYSSWPSTSGRQSGSGSTTRPPKALSLGVTSRPLSTRTGTEVSQTTLAMARTALSSAAREAAGTTTAANEPSTLSAPRGHASPSPTPLAACSLPRLQGRASLSTPSSTGATSSVRLRRSAGRTRSRGGPCELQVGICRGWMIRQDVGVGLGGVENATLIGACEGRGPQCARTATLCGCLVSYRCL